MREYLAAKKNKLQVYVELNPDNRLQLEEEIPRDIRCIGHFGTGDLKINIRTKNLTKAEPLILRSYEVR